MDGSSGVLPKHSIRGEWFVTIAFLTGVVSLIAEALGTSIWLSARIAFLIGYVVRVTALDRAREEPLGKEPQRVYLHDHGRTMLGRNRKGKSERGSASSASSRRDDARPAGVELRTPSLRMHRDVVATRAASGGARRSLHAHPSIPTSRPNTDRCGPARKRADAVR